MGWNKFLKEPMLSPGWSDEFFFCKNLICRLYRELKNSSKNEVPFAKKHFHVAYLQSMFHQGSFAIVKKFPLFFLMVQASIYCPTSMEEG
jgi:hypothetical protein